MSIRIGDAAAELGIAPSTLRYYEEIDLAVPSARGSNGYRTYDDDAVERLRFIVDAKSLGIPLDEIRVLADAYASDDCSDVAHSVAEAIARQLTQTRQRIQQLETLAAQLEAAQTKVSAAPTSGPCGPNCPCSSVSRA